MATDSNIPFYLMGTKEKSNPAEYPTDSNEEISGLEEAIKNTEKSLAEDKYDKSELEFHLKGLRRQLEIAKENKRKKENR